MNNEQDKAAQLKQLAIKFVRKGYTTEQASNSDDLYDATEDDRDECTEYMSEIISLGVAAFQSAPVTPAAAQPTLSNSTELEVAPAQPIAHAELLAEVEWCIAEGNIGPRSRECLESVRAALAAAPSPVAQGEREQFEVWANSLDMNLARVTYAEDIYSDCNTDFAWQAWQARAATPAQDKQDTAGKEDNCAILCNGMPVENVQLDWVCAFLTENSIFDGKDIYNAWNELVRFYVANRSTPLPADSQDKQDAEDAARYRWLKESALKTVTPTIGTRFWILTSLTRNHDNFDADVDAALQAQGAKE